MKAKALMVILVLCVIGGGAAYDMLLRPKPYTRPAAPAPAPDKEQWQPVPDVRLTTLDGNTVGLTELAGKVVLLNFWATWCPTCIKDFPGMKKTADRYNGDVVIVALSNDEDEQDIERFLLKYKEMYGQDLSADNFIICWDKGRNITSNVFNTARFPETILISRNSRMAHKLIGEVEWESAEVRSVIEGLVKSR
ncbi:MAG: TlpA family protein disulfide reductase [Candidatus Omnitrophica bacterium]|nr:TlpA family protein disulfide reductase [Candidatus Omnitrophota bacterium]MCB9720916.1 TlpA family protein disulfide reductase [Candidatus Omnitrophota bacterium]